MKTLLALVALTLTLAGCAIVPYGPGPGVYAAPPPPPAVVVRPYYGYHYGYAPYWRRW